MSDSQPQLPHDQRPDPEDMYLNLDLQQLETLYVRKAELIRRIQFLGRMCQRGMDQVKSELRKSVYEKIEQLEKDIPQAFADMPRLRDRLLLTAGRIPVMHTASECSP